MKIIQDNLVLCSDCMLLAETGDYSFYSANAPKRVEEIKSGLDRLGRNLVCNFDSETGDGVNEFSSRTCDCCNSNLAGTRYRYAVLG
jgi:hypothetical protein